MFDYFEGRYKKLIFYSFETAKNWSFETAKNWIYETFLQVTFLQFQNCKKIAYGNGDFIFHNFTATCFQKPFLCSFDTPKKRGFKTATMPAFWNPRLQPQKDVVVCINGFLDVLKLLHTRSFDTSFPYLGR